VAGHEELRRTHFALSDTGSLSGAGILRLLLQPGNHREGASEIQPFDVNGARTKNLLAPHGFGLSSPLPL
jgi:hypothetical protein